MQKLLKFPISIMCSRNHWHIVMGNIRTFLNDIPDKQLVECFCVELSYSPSENIRFTLLAREEHRNRLMEYLDGNLKKYIPNAFSTQEPGKSTAHSDAFNQNLVMRHVLSKIILENLSGEPVNEENILTLSFYLHMVLINIILKMQPGLAQELFEMYGSIDSLEPIDSDIMYGKYIANEAVLLEISTDIVHDRCVDNFPSLDKWEMACKNLVSAGTAENEGQMTIANLHNLAVFQVHRQLGLNKSNSLTLFYFVKEVLARCW